MSKLLAFVKLDFITVKPYLTLKNLFIFIVMGVIMSMGSENSGSSIGMVMVFGTLYVSFPFAVGEKNGIDTLYATLSISRSDVVLGRYLFALCIDLSAALLSYLLSFGIFTAFNKSFSSYETLSIIAVVFVIMVIIQLVQLPIYFRLSYANAKFLAYIPLFGFSLITVLSVFLFKGYNIMEVVVRMFEWVANNPLLTVLISAAVLAFFAYISYLMSLSFYKKRDF